MVEFNADLPKGRPQLDKDYWQSQNKKENNDQSNIDIVTDFALKKLEDVSVFFGNK